MPRGQEELGVFKETNIAGKSPNCMTKIRWKHNRPSSKSSMELCLITRGYNKKDQNLNPLINFLDFSRGYNKKCIKKPVAHLSKAIPLSFQACHRSHSSERRRGPGKALHIHCGALNSASGADLEVLRLEPNWITLRKPNMAGK